jgi:DNA-binding IscR family transcriptional regulator
MNHLGDGTTSLAIAKSLHTNPVVVLRLLKSMERAGLVALRQGRDGGVGFARSPEDITLDQVYSAVEAGGEVFALREGGNPKCPVDRAMPGALGPVFAAVDQAVGDVLRRTTIGSLMKDNTP